MVAFGVYAVFKLQSYRLLITKSQVYDAMRQYKLLYNFVWYFTHSAYMVMAVCFIFVIILSDYTIEHTPTTSSPSLCVLTPPTRHAQAVLFGILAGFDTWICLGSLILLWLPVRGVNVQSSVKVAVARNFIGGGIAIISTLAFGSFSILLDVTGSYYPSIVIQAGMYDELINIVALNLTYPIAYYIQSLQTILVCICGEKKEEKEEAKEHKGRNNSRMNWVVRMHSRTGASRSGRDESPCSEGGKSSRSVGSKSLRSEVTRTVTSDEASPTHRANGQHPLIAS